MALLSGLRVLELSEEVSAPFAGRLLAGLGASVIRIEPPDGDPIRREGPFPPRIPATDRHDGAGFFHYLNAGKRVLRLDLEQPADRQRVHELAVAADLILENYAPGVLGHLGLGFEQIAALNPSAGYVSVTAFGQDGPYRDYLATDMLAFLAFARFSDVGLAGRPPIRYAPHVAEMYAGTLAAAAGLAAQRLARARREAVHADISIAECVLTSPDRAFALYPFLGAALPRPEEYRPVLFRTSDDQLVLINTGLDWERSAALIGREDLLGDERFSSLSARTRSADEVYALVAAWALDYTAAEIVEALSKHRVLGGLFYRPEDTLSDPHFAAREFFEPLTVDGAPSVLAPSMPMKVDGVRLRLAALSMDDSGRWPAGGEVRRAGSVGVTRPLEGVRVIDLGELYAGPFACSLLADLGADVIKVENVNRMPAVVRGDRHPVSPAFGYFESDPGDLPWERFFLYHVVERNKRGITLDLKTGEGLALFQRLVALSDGVVTNYTPRALRSLGISSETLQAVRRDIVFVHLPGFGCDGPYADRVSVGPVAEALSGHWAVRGYPDIDPVFTSQSVWADALGAANAVLAFLAGLELRERTGRGCFIDISQAEAMTAGVTHALLDYQWNGRPSRRLADKDDFICPHGCYPAAGEDAWVAIAAPDDETWRRLALAIGRPDLAADSALGNISGRKANERAIDAAIAAWTSSRVAPEVVGTLQPAGVPCVKLLRDDEVGSDPQIVARGLLEEVDHPVVGKYWNVGSPFRFSRISRVERRPPNLVGQHNVDVLGGLLGLTDSELTRLEAGGVIGSRFR
jgi:crotonobetainyl-CoA:carnitine CoA-transferase CaiB-like acyl-CoA transferase